MRWIVYTSLISIAFGIVGFSDLAFRAAEIARILCIVFLLVSIAVGLSLSRKAKGHSQSEASMAGAGTDDVGRLKY